MNILYLHQHFSTRQGSAGVRSYEFARLWQQDGQQVTILCGWGDRSGLPRQATETYTLEGMQVIALAIPYSQHMSYIRRVWSFVWFVIAASWAAIRLKKIDVIFATSTPLTIGVPAMIASFVKRRPFVFEVRDLWPEAPIQLGVLRNPVLVAVAKGLAWLIYRRAAHIVALSPGMKEGIVKTGIKPEKVSVIPNASDLELFDVPASAGEAFRAQHPHLAKGRLVVYLGAFGYTNGLDYLVRVAQHVSQQDSSIHFLLVGDGRCRDEVRALAQSLELTGRTLWFMDPVSHQDVPAILSAADLTTSIVIPNPVMQITSANKFFDSLAAGRPIAINHEGWQADLLRETGAGIVLPPDDPAAAARLLVDFLRDEQRLEQARQAARQLAQERFDRKLLASQLESILQKVARRESVQSVDLRE